MHVFLNYQVFDGEVKVDNTVLKVKLNIWDTAGEEKYRSITSVYYRNTDAALIVFDLTRQETFDSIQDWLTNIHEHCSREVYTVLVGNKCDQETKVDSSEIDVSKVLSHFLHPGSEFIRKTRCSALVSLNVLATFGLIQAHFLIFHFFSQICLYST